MSTAALGLAVVAAACGGPAPHRPSATPPATTAGGTIGPGPGPTTTEGTSVPATTTTESSAPATSATAGASPGGSAPGVSPQAALAALARSLGPDVAASPVTSPAPYAAVAHATPPASGPTAGVPTLVDVFHWTGSSWQPVATNLGSGAALDPHSPFTVTTASLTGSRSPDFVISGAAGASASGLFVVADVAGHWEAVPVDHSQGGVVLINGRVSGSEVQESINSCNPNCAAGQETTTSYRFSPTTGRFEPVGTPTVAGPGQP